MCESGGPGSGAVDDVLITGDLERRVSRPADHAAENRALSGLAAMMERDPAGLPQTCAELVLDLCRAGSAGISVLEPGGEQGVFRWAGAAGALGSKANATVPREASIDGVAIDHGRVLLFDRPDRVFPMQPMLADDGSRPCEVLVAPWFLDGKPVGTIWAASHDPDARFESEDARLLRSLAPFASAAHRIGLTLADADAARQELTRRADERGRALRHSEELRRIALESGRMATWGWDTRRRLVRADAEFRALFGLPPSDEPHPDSAYTALLGPDSAAGLEALAAKEIAPDEEFDGHVEIVAGPAAGRWIRWRGRAGREKPWIINGISFDVTGQRLVDGRLRENEERFRQFADASSDALWIRDLETLRWDYLSRAFNWIYGLDRDVALAEGTVGTLLDMIVPDDRERTLAAIRGLQHGEGVYEYRIVRPSDGQVRWLRTTGFPLLDAAGRVQRLGGITKDMTEEKRASDRMQVLVAELQHRTRNLIAVIQSVALRTLGHSATLEAFRERFQERLRALARANDLLSRLEEGDRIAFDELLETELSGHGLMDEQRLSPQVTLDGPRGVQLRSASVQTLALAVHELLTNAMKHGALSRRQGRLGIRWSLVEVEGESRLRVVWEESGVQVPPGAQEARSGSGYGLELIERALPYQLEAAVDYDLRPQGLRCVITLPVSARPRHRR